MAFLPSELIVNAWFLQTQEQTARRNWRTIEITLNLGRIVLFWGKSMGRAASLACQQPVESTDSNHSQERGKYCGTALRSKIRRHTGLSRRKRWSGAVKTEVASELVATHTALNHYVWKSGEHSPMPVKDSGGPYSLVAQCHSWEV